MSDRVWFEITGYVKQPSSDGIRRNGRIGIGIVSGAL